MIACYDLARCPPTYDVVAFLAHAELERVRRREEHLDIHILPGPASGFRRDSLWPRSIEERVHMRDNVLVPLCRLLPSVRSVTVDADRSVEGWGKDAYNISLPAIVRALQQGCRPLRYQGAAVPNALGPGTYITFTLREAEHHQLRNSRVEEWEESWGKLARAGHRILIIRDAAKYNEQPTSCQTEAPVNLHVRAQLYANAKLNVGISNGPMWMSIFMDAPTLMLRPTTNEAVGCYDDRFYAKWGVPRGSQLPNSPPHQCLVWEEDYADNIVRAVEGMLQCAS